MRRAAIGHPGLPTANSWPEWSIVALGAEVRKNPVVVGWVNFDDSCIQNTA
jgi:hypothetical protein